MAALQRENQKELAMKQFKCPAMSRETKTSMPPLDPSSLLARASVMAELLSTQRALKCNRCRVKSHDLALCLFFGGFESLSLCTP